MKLLLDTSFIISYVNIQDETHDKSVELEEKYDIFSQECHITNTQVNEIISIVNNTLDLNASQEIYESLKQTCEVTNEFEINNFNNLAMDIFIKYRGKLTFTQSTLVLLMEKTDFDYLVSIEDTFDKIKNLNMLK